jgi:hypothetical protein
MAWNPPRATEATAESFGLRWERPDEDEQQFHLYQGDRFIGEAYEVDARSDGSTGKWHCKLSDWRDLEPTIEDARRALLARCIHTLAAGFG